MTWPGAALLSLAEKRGADAFARALVARGTRLYASGGTARHLEVQGIAVTALESLTGFGELLAGRVKTLHPHVHAPILARRDRSEDLAELAERGLPAFDLVAVSLYPFEEHGRALDDAGMIEHIDIGGVALLRAAAKNHQSVIVIHDPAQYDEVLEALGRDAADLARRRTWAAAALAHTARYDAAIAAELARRTPASAAADDAPPLHVLALERARSLRYGENPHQRAALYARAGDARALEAWREGKELSYNNLLDLEAAVLLVWRFDEPGCVIVKHTQPCGVAAGSSLAAAWEGALRSDELSAYGGVVAFNRALDGGTARRLALQFVECVAAPAFSPEAGEALKSKKNLRLVSLAPQDLASPDPWALRLVGRWGLLQREPDDPAPAWKAVTNRPPTSEEETGLRFAWEVVSAARSNAIALARGTVLIGLGSGQTSRVDAVDLAIMKARRAGHDPAGAVLASDGFFPFADSIERAAAAGIRAVVQPGGSIRDGEVIAACDRAGLAMSFTDRREFRH